MTSFALVNQSTETSLTPEVCTAIAAAVQTQIVRDYGSLWQAGPAPVRFCTAESDAAPADTLIVLLDDADQQGALGYHDLTPAGRPYARIFVKTILANGGSLTAGPNSVSVCVSHEALEVLGDPYCNCYADSPVAQYAWELCDPVEGDSYQVNGVSVSDFVGPRWFDPEDKGGPWDMLSVLRGPMSLAPNGYVIQRSPGGQATAVFGDLYPSWKRDQKVALGSRFRRRRKVARFADSQ